MSVYTKLMQARLELQSTKLSKSGQNKFAGYQYFELGDFLPTVQRIFDKIGLCGVISFGKELATLTITDFDFQADDPNGTIIITSPMSEAALKGCHAVQNLGAVQTYLRRYLWVTAMEIVEHDALDATVGKDSTKIKSMPKAEVSEDEKVYLEDLADECSMFVKCGSPRKAYERIEENALDNEQKIYLWSILDSSTRSAIKSSRGVSL